MFPVGYTTQITSYQWEEVKPINALSIWDNAIIIFGSKEQGWLENVVKSKLNNAKNTGGREKNKSKEIVQKLGQEIFQGRATAEAEAISNADWQSDQNEQPRSIALFATASLPQPENLALSLLHAKQELNHQSHPQPGPNL